MKRKIILLSALAIIVVIILSIVIINNKSKAADREKTDDEIYLEKFEKLKEESPYTLDEIYAMVEDPQIIEHLSTPSEIDENATEVPYEFLYVMTHFYNYFSKSTPFKIVTKLKTVEGEFYKIEEVYEFAYISYEEYNKILEEMYIEEEEMRELQEKTENRKVPSYVFYMGKEYEFYLRQLLYSEGVHNESKGEN